MVKKFRPATPFLTPFLVSSYKNFTDVQLYSQIYPLWTYSYLVALIPIFFLTDALRHKPIVVLEAMSYCASHAIILWGLSTASDIAYVSYMYAVIDQKHFKRITSYVRAATLFGKFLAYGSGQLLISAHLVSYLQLHEAKKNFFSKCLFFEVQNYVQNLWALLQQDDEAYNGITECTATLIGAIVCFFVQYLKIDWVKCGELVIWINSMIIAILLIVMSQTTSAFIAYIFYIALAIIYQLLMTAASTIIATELTTATYGLVFGSSTFVALLLQTILTLIVVDKHGLALDIRTQVSIF
ncbi:unnamed protein product [Brugia pahangi]|uniref:Thiamine transporter 2 n=1 Tax=Brugia pahangi TaxID=6280 RepID=A0A0N4TPS0_BRUPA|nr:unnamed protein product [Brugia pahangi]